MLEPPDVAAWKALHGATKSGPKMKRYVPSPPPEGLVQLGGVDAVQPDQLVGDDDGIAVNGPWRGR